MFHPDSSLKYFNQFILRTIDCNAKVTQCYYPGCKNNNTVTYCKENSIEENVIFNAWTNVCRNRYMKCCFPVLGSWMYQNNIEEEEL